MFLEVRQKKSTKIIEKFLQKYFVTSSVIKCFRVFYKNILEMQRIFKKVKLNQAIRRSVGLQKFEKEVDYLLWYFKREYKNCRSPKEKKELNNFIDRLDKGRVKQDIMDQRELILRKFYEINMCEYMLDYTIWCFVRSQKKTDKLKQELDEYDLQEDQEYLR